MASSRFLERSLRVVGARVAEKRRSERKRGQRSLAMLGGLVLAGAMFFVLKAAAMASGLGLPEGEGIALWLAGPDPVSATMSALLQPIFAGRG